MLPSIEHYLETVGQCRNDGFGLRFRNQFRDSKGSAELGMLAAPSEDEYQEMRRVAAVMTTAEKDWPEGLSDEDIRAIASRCEADSGRAAIFLNGYVLARKKARLDADIKSSE